MKTKSITLTSLLLLQQLYSENTEVDAWRDGANASNMPSSTPSCGHVSDKKNLSQELTCVKEMDEYPSFDLGF